MTKLFLSFLVINLLNFNIKVNSKQNSQKPFSNPALIYGTSFGNYFQSLFRMGKFDEMIKFTSNKSVKKFGKKSILELYNIMNFGYALKLKSKTENKDKSITLNYETMINATKGILRLSVIVENDSAKVILRSLNKNNPF